MEPIVSLSAGDLGVLLAITVSVGMALGMLIQHYQDKMEKEENDE